MAKIVAVVQARTSSTRLPRKVLAPVGEHSLIARVLSQVSGSKLLDDVIVATSVDPGDDQLAEHLRALGANVFRGDLHDVLGRFAAAAAYAEATTVVRLTGDCPLHAPDTIDEVISAFIESGCDYATNNAPYTRPDGQDVEVFTRSLLEHTLTAAESPTDREHVTPYMKRAPGARRLNVLHRTGPHGAHLRWSVDDPPDLEFARRVWAELDRQGPTPHPYDRIFAVATTVSTGEQATVVNAGYYKSLYDTAPGEKAAGLALQRSAEWLSRSAKVVPGGAQTYSKSWRQHIQGVSPVFLSHGKGAWVWDVDENPYVDLIQGLLPNILGYARPEVDQAVYERTRCGHSFSLAHPLEVELAERLIGIIPCAEMVRFGKNGSDATAGAVRAARAFTGRDRVAICGYHGWQDWYIGTTSRHKGVPGAVSALSHPFPYNDPAALRTLLESHPGEFATVIMEPVNFTWPTDGYLAEVKRIAHEHGALLIFDEICTGFHFGPGGAQRLFGVTPDMATFGKAMGNGYPISCIVGRRDVMEVFDEVFVSFTFAGEVGAMAAAMKVLDILEQTDAYARIEHAARKLREGAVALAQLAGLGTRFQVHGHPHWTLLRFLTPDGQEDAVLRALWQQEVTRRGVLIIATHNISAALDDEALDHVLGAYAAAFKHIGGLVQRGANLLEHLDGPVPTPAFRARG